MNKDKALESVFEIKELMEKSSKFISVSGLAAILAGIYALAGAYIATQVITSDMYLSDTLKLMAIIAMSVLAAAAVTAGILSYCKSQKTGQKFFSRLTYRALWNFSLPMLTGGAFSFRPNWECWQISPKSSSITGETTQSAVPHAM